MKVCTATGLLACLVRRAGFLGWTRFWRTIYVLPGHERNEREGRLLFSIRYLYWLARRGYWNNPYEAEARAAECSSS